MGRLLCLFTLGTFALLSLTTSAESQAKKKPKAAIWSDQKDAFGDPLPVGAIARIGTMRYRINGADMPALSSDGKLLAVSGERDDIVVWELPEWKKHRTLNRKSLDTKKQVQFQGAAFSHDGKQVATFDSAGNQVVLIDVATNKAVKTLPFEEKDRNQNPVLTISRDQQTLIASYQVPIPNGNGPGQQFKVFDLAKGKLKQSLLIDLGPGGAGPTHFAIAADGRRLAQALTVNNPGNRRNGVDAFLEIYDLDTGKSIKKVEVDFVMQHVAFSPDSKWIAATNGQSTLRIYDAATGKEAHNLRLGRAMIDHLAFAPDSDSFYVADTNATISRYDVATGDRKAKHRTPVDEPVRGIAFAPDGKVYALALGLDALFYWEIATGKLLSPTGVPGSMISGLMFSPKGELFVASEDGMVGWWNPRTGAKLRDLKLELIDGDFPLLGPIDIVERPRRLRDFGPGSMLGRVSMSASTEFLAALDGGAASIFDAKTGKFLYDDDAAANGDTVIGFLEGGARAAGVRNKKVRIWNSRTGRDVSSFELPLRVGEQVQKLAVTDSGGHFAFATNGDENIGHRVLVFDAQTKKQIREWQDPDMAEAIQFSPDERWLATAALRDEVRLSRAAAGKGEYHLPLNNRNAELTQIQFSPDSRQLAVAAVVPTNRPLDAGKIYIFELASKKVRLELVGHPSGIIDHLAYAADSGLLASGATDTTVLVWQAGLRAFLPSPPGRGAGGEGEPTPDELAASFKEMAGGNPKIAFQHMVKLARSPKQAIKLFDEKIVAARKPESGEKSIEQWIQDLSNGQFAVRSRATEILKKLGPTAEPDLVAALPKVRDVETRRRIEDLLNRLSAHEWTAEEILHTRAVEVLDAIASSESRGLLTRWSKGDPAAVLTQEAGRALGMK